MRACVGLSSAVWKNGGSDPDAVWHHRSDGSRDEVGSGVWGSVHGVTSREGVFWELYGVRVRQRRDAALFPNILGRLAVIIIAACCSYYNLRAAIWLRLVVRLLTTVNEQVGLHCWLDTSERSASFCIQFAWHMSLSSAGVILIALLFIAEQSSRFISHSVLYSSLRYTSFMCTQWMLFLIKYTALYFGFVPENRPSQQPVKLKRKSLITKWINGVPWVSTTSPVHCHQF